MDASAATPITRTAATPPAIVGTGAQDDAFDRMLAATASATPDARRAAPKPTARVMRPIPVPKAAPLPGATTPVQTGRTMTAAQARDLYGAGTLADILRRIRRV